jgi:predicted nucleotidyltransferase
MQLSEQSADALSEWAAQFAAIKSLWLFGSRAKGIGRHDSDTDIA